MLHGGVFFLKTSIEQILDNRQGVYSNYDDGNPKYEHFPNYTAVAILCSIPISLYVLLCVHFLLRLFFHHFA